MKVKALGACHPDCTMCANTYWRWVKARMGQMSKPNKGDTTSFAVAASTSIRPS